MSALTGDGRPATVPASLHRLLHPESVAVVGATDRPGSYAGQVLRNLARARFPGRVIGVHPTRREVLGVACVPDLDALGRPVDAVVVATPAPTVAAVVEAAGRHGCGGAVVLAAGFGETADGAAAHAALVAAAARHELPVIGPNANGLVAVAARAPLWGDPVTLPERPGPVALLTQSGNLGVIALAHRRGLGLHTVVSLGNAAVVDAATVLAHLAEERARPARPGSAFGAVGCVAAYLEDDGDGERLARALAACAATDLRVVVLKAGRSPAGAAAGAAHTAALAGDADAFHALVESAGGIVVRQPHELLETARALADRRRHPGRLAVVTCSGGDAAIAADLAQDVGVELATFSPQTSATLAALVPRTATVANPFDHTTQVWNDPAALTAITAAVAADPDVGHLIYVQDEPPDLPDADAQEWAATREGAVRGARTGGLAALVVATTAGLEPPGAVSGLEPALRAVAMLRRPAPDPLRLIDIAAASRAVRGRVPGPWLSEHTAKDLLAAAGVALPRRTTVPVTDHAGRPRDEAAVLAEVVAAAQGLRGAVALKASRPGLIHKTAHGAVVLGLIGPGAVAVAARDLLRRSRSTAAATATMATMATAANEGSRLDEALLVEEMVDPGLELIVAARTDGVVPTLTIGLGGAWAQALDDVTSVPLPVRGPAVVEAADRLRSADLLRSRIGESGARQGLSELCETISALLIDRPLVLVELNPVIVAPSGTVIAVDAVVRRALPGRRPGPRLP